MSNPSPRVLVFGGGFDMINNTHLAKLSRTLFLFGHERGYVVPSSVKLNSSPGHLRAQMTGLAIAGNPKLKLVTYEVDNPGDVDKPAKVSIDTLKEIRRIEGPDVGIDFLMGEDNVEVLYNYDRRDEFLSLCRPIIAPRGSDEPLDVLKARWQALLGPNVEALDCPSDSWSSTVFRRWVAEGQSLRYVVPPKVAAFIKKNGLYRNANRNLKTYHGILYPFWETGTEGVIWSLVEQPPKPGYEGLHELHNGDHLTVYNHDNSIVWQGIINFEHKTGWQRYPRNPKYGQQCALGMWVHGNQRGFKNINDWAEMFFAGKLKEKNRYQPLRAILVKNMLGLPRPGE